MEPNAIGSSAPAAASMWRDHTVADLKKLKNSRWYAFDDASLTALAALAAAWWDRQRADGPNASFTREALTKFFEQIAPVIPGLMQQRPADPTKPPEWPKDPMTGQPVAIKDVTSMNLLAKHNPDLWHEIKRREKSGGVLTYKQLL